MRPEAHKPPAVPDTLAPGDQLLAAGLGVGAAASGLMWATGQLAGLAFGHTWLELDPAEVARVLVQLRHHLNDPALAWPATAQQALPGPAGMYASFAATTAGVAGTTGGLMRLWQRAGLGNPTAPPALGQSAQRPARPPGPPPGNSGRCGSVDLRRDG
jgi:hypothetical protein